MPLVLWPRLIEKWFRMFLPNTKSTMLTWPSEATTMSMNSLMSSRETASMSSASTSTTRSTSSQSRRSTTFLRILSQHASLSSWSLDSTSCFKRFGRLLAWLGSTLKRRVRHLILLSPSSWPLPEEAWPSRMASRRFIGPCSTISNQL